MQNGSTLSINLQVPKEVYGGGETTRSLAGAGLPTIRGGKVKTVKTKKSSRLKGATDDVSSNRTGGIGPGNPRSKSRSPNPSFNSVLSRVKDWEIGAFTPKTALRDNVDVSKSNQPFSNSSVDSLVDGRDRNRSGFDVINKSDFEPWKPSPTGSPDHTIEGQGDGSAAAQADGNGEKPAPSALLKSTLSSNIGVFDKLSVMSSYNMKYMIDANLVYHSR